MRTTSARAGVMLAGAAYVMWGLFPAFFKLLLHVDPLRVLAHRGLWAGAVAVLVLVAWRRDELRAFWQSGHRGRQLATLVLTAVLLASNWGIYIHAVASGQVTQASLGYFICPLVMVGLGVFFAGPEQAATERPPSARLPSTRLPSTRLPSTRLPSMRLGHAQWLALALAGAGVAQLVVRDPAAPWLALYLAGSFGAYGVLRKRLPLDPLLASSLEALVMVPFALAYLGLARPEALVVATTDGALLVASGVVTAVPLMLFAAGAKRLPYFTLGLLQYLTPTLQLLLAVVAYGEPLGSAQLVTFALIWAALSLSSLDAGRRAWLERLRASAGATSTTAAPSPRPSSARA